MRTSWTGAWLALALLAAATGCNRNKGDGAADPQSMDPASALVEERDDGKLEWNISSDGQVRVRITANEGAATAASGAILVNGQSFPLSGDGTTLTASIPKLDSGLTTITYSLKVRDATWEGALHVPAGGTKELVAVPSVTVPDGAKGPHGGVLDVVGDQRVEIVVDQKTGEVRVYMLDDKLQPVPVGSASAVVGFQQAPGQAGKAAAQPGQAPPNGGSPSINSPSPKGL